MDREMKSDRGASSVTPYEVHRDCEVWKVVERAISDLVKNGDLIERTRRDYIVGYICKKLRENNDG